MKQISRGRKKTVASLPERIDSALDQQQQKNKGAQVRACQQDAEQQKKEAKEEVQHAYRGLVVEEWAAPENMAVFC